MLTLLYYRVLSSDEDAVRHSETPSEISLSFDVNLTRRTLRRPSIRMMIIPALIMTHMIDTFFHVHHIAEASKNDIGS